MNIGGNIMLKYYINFEDEFKFKYSLDMLRYNINIGDNTDTLLSYINKFNITSYSKIDHYIGRGLYHYLYKVKLFDDDNSCSFSFGFGLLSKTENRNSGFIEFNPNKCFQLPIFKVFITNFFGFCRTIKLVRYDLAIDIPCNRNQIKMVKTSNHRYESITSYLKVGEVINKSVTEYQGVRSHNKFTKLYDKGIESDLGYNLTRIEFTFDREETTFNGLPKFFFYDSRILPNLDFSSLSSSDIVLIDLLRNSDNLNLYIRNLPRSKVKKIFSFLYDYNLKLDFNLFLKIRTEALSFEKN